MTAVTTHAVQRLRERTSSMGLGRLRAEGIIRRAVNGAFATNQVLPWTGGNLLALFRYAGCLLGAVLVKVDDGYSVVTVLTEEMVNTRRAA